MHMDQTGGSVGALTPHPMSDLAPTGESVGSVRQFSRVNGSAGDANGVLPLAAQMAALIAENKELRAEVERLRAERARLAELQGRVMEVLGCKSPDRLVHDLRNVLNERELYRALADAVM